MCYKYLFCYSYFLNASKGCKREACQEGMTPAAMPKIVEKRTVLPRNKSEMSRVKISEPKNLFADSDARNANAKPRAEPRIPPITPSKADSIIKIINIA